MVASLSSSLNAARTNLQFSQNALSVVSNNIANANTVGYTRQVIQSETQVYNGQSQGVTDGVVIRYTDDKIQSKLNTQNSHLEYAKTIRDYLSTIEGHFGTLDNPETTNSSNLDKQIADLFTKTNNLINDPLSSSDRIAMKDAAQHTADRLNSLAGDLLNDQIHIDWQIDNSIEVINTAIENIHSLNQQVNEIYLAGGDTSALQDLRQAEIDTLSEYFSISVRITDSNAAQVSLDSGKVLVDNSSHVNFTRAVSSGKFGDIGFQRVMPDGTTENSPVNILMNNDLQSGKMGALINVRDNEIPNLLAQLDLFAVAFIEEFNNIHAQGIAVPPPNVLTGIESIGAATLLTDVGLTAGTDFDISIVDPNGNPVVTTVGDYTGSVTNSTVAGITAGSFDPQTYLATNGSNAKINGTATIDYVGAGVYRMTDPSGGVQLATLNPNAFPTAGVATLEFANGVNLNVNAGTAEPVVGVIGTIDLQTDSGPIRIEDGDTLQDLVDRINNNTSINSEVTASIVNNSLVLTSNNTSNGVILGNDPTGDTFNKFGFNRFFEGTGASNMKVTDEIASDVSKITTARMRADGGITSTNNTNMVELANLQNKEFSFASSGTLNAQDNTLTGYFFEITSSFATTINANETAYEFNYALHDDYYGRLQSVAGVNTDEEFSNMIIYQRSFEASSRVIQTIDQLMEQLMSMI